MNKHIIDHGVMQCEIPEGECGLDAFHSSEKDVMMLVRKWMFYYVAIDILLGVFVAILITPLLGLLCMVVFLRIDLKRFDDSFKSALAFCCRGIWLLSLDQQPRLILKENVVSVDYEEIEEIAGAMASHVFLRIETADKKFSRHFVLTREDNRRLVRVLTLGYSSRRDQGPWSFHGSAH